MASRNHPHNACWPFLPTVLRFCVLIYKCMCLHTYACTSVCICVWRPEGDTVHLSLLPSTLRFEMCSLTDQELTRCTRWAAQESCPSHLIIAGTTGTVHHDQVFCGC